MAKIDVTQVLLSYDGDELTETRSEERGGDQPLTLRYVLVEALGFNTKAERTNGVNSVEVSRRFMLMQQLHKQDKVDYTAEEIADLKTRITEMYAGMQQPKIVIAGSALSALDPVAP